MADTLEQIAEHIEAMNRDCVPGCEDCRRQRTRAILSALQSLARERDAAQAWAREQSMEEREQRKRAETAEQSRDALQQRVESLSQSLFAALERCQAAVQEPRGQEGE
jgi:hypothetical protein